MAKQTVKPSTPWVANSTTPRADQAYKNGNRSDDWLVHSGRSYLSPLSLQVVHPRPDIETNTFAAHRKAHSQLTYDVEIDVMFGCWPYRYEIIEGHPTATIGSTMDKTLDVGTGLYVHTPSATYGKLTADLSGESQDFVQNWRIRVTDQLGATVDVTWSTTLKDSDFVFVNSATGNDANAGTFAAPLQTFANGLWKNSDADATFAGKVAVFTGTFDINAGTIPSSPLLDTTKKPIAYIANGSATFSMSNGHFRNGSTTEDILFKDIALTGSRTDLANNRILSMSWLCNRFSVHRCSASNMTAGTDGTDNCAVLGFMAPVGTHSYLSFKRNTIGANVPMQFELTFESQYKSVQMNTGLSLNSTAGNSAYGVNSKDDTSYVCYRGNEMVGDAAALFMLQNQNTGGTITDQEVCYNTMRLTSATSTDSAIVVNLSGLAQNTHVYRNSIVAESGRAVRFEGAEPIAWFNDAFYVGSSNAVGSSFTPVNANASVSLLLTDFDANNELTGSARSSYLGTYGAEVAG